MFEIVTPYDGSGACDVYETKHELFRALAEITAPEPHYEDDDCPTEITVYRFSSWEERAQAHARGNEGEYVALVVDDLLP